MTAVLASMSRTCVRTLQAVAAGLEATSVAGVLPSSRA
ncbi:hypothetical protein BKA01_003096 [Pseudonocardia eucalypti]|nr:hypothetical protein [Pseudonocardia eucalypti]